MALNIKKGDVYDLNILDNRLRNDPDAVGALYMDNGYLFYSANPVEVGVENDSVERACHPPGDPD